MTVAGLLLAAGAGRRMGAPKALAVLDGERLVERALRVLSEGGCAPLVVVLGAGSESVRPFCGAATVVLAPDWSTGMAASLRAGLLALSELGPGGVRTKDAEHRTAAASELTGCVVALVDQPGMTAAVVEQVRTAPGPAAVASYAGRQRNPVRLDRETWPGVAAAAEGDAGARTWLRAHPEQVHEVDCTALGYPDDLDTPADLRRAGGSLPADVTAARAPTEGAAR